MFTMNWYKYIAASMGYKKLSLVNVSGTSIDSDYTGVSLNMYNNGVSNGCRYPNMHKVLTTTGGEGGIVLGDGTVAPSLNDYFLSGNMLKTFTYTASVTITDDNDGRTISSLLTITNTDSSSITIGELGLIAANKDSNAASLKYMFERTVLENPVTIEAGGVGQVTYTIRMNYPTA